MTGEESGQIKYLNNLNLSKHHIIIKIRAQINILMQTKGKINIFF